MVRLPNEGGRLVLPAALRSPLGGRRMHAGEQFVDLAQQTLAGTLSPGMPFLRRYYAMAQVQEREIKNVLDVMVRFVRSLEENSGLASLIAEWQVTKRIQLFTIDSIAFGGKETEFRSIIDKNFLAGVEVHF